MNVKPGICKGKESILADPVEAQHYLVDSQKDHLEIQPVEASENNNSILKRNQDISVPEKIDCEYTCTESNLDVIKPSVILGTNSSSKLGASPFRYGTDVTNLDHNPKR